MTNRHATLTIPKVYGEEGFNVIRQALIEYCEKSGKPIDLAFGYQWDDSVMLLKDDNLTDEEFQICDTALKTINHYLNKPNTDPWKAVQEAQEEWAENWAEAERLLRDYLDEQNQKRT